MNKFQRIKSLFLGFVLILFAVLLLIVPDIAFEFVAGIIGLIMFIYGFKILWYYLTMARHMVGGKTLLYQSVIILDIALFTGSMASMNSFIILFYLLGVFAFSGIVDILRAFETKRFGSSSWKLKLISGFFSVLFSLLMLILGIVFKDKVILVYGFAVSLIYKGLVRIFTAFRKTAIIYIQIL